MMRRSGKRPLKTNAHYYNDGIWCHRVWKRNRRRMHPYGMIGLRKGPGCQCAVCRDDIPQARARFKADTTRIVDEWQKAVTPDPWDDDLEFCGPWTRLLVDTESQRVLRHVVGA